MESGNKRDITRDARGKAADALLALIAAGHSHEPPGTYEGIAVDCLRRSNRFPEAIACIEQFLGGGFADIIVKVLNFQRTLIERGDTDAHTIAEAVDPNGRPMGNSRSGADRLKLGL